MSTDLNGLVKSVHAYLATHRMFADNEWLKECVTFLKEQGSCSLTDIQNLSREQWLLNDLKDICPGSLPPNLKAHNKTMLNGRFVLQINSTVDIGTPAYQQYLKLQNVNLENIEATVKYEDKIPSHRMIKLELTDGVQEISAIEYKPMRNLHCNVTPGSKIHIKGSVECRRGMLLLTESNIELLGGEVQEISVSNSMAAILAKKLNLTNDPATINQNLISSQPRNSNIPTPFVPPAITNEYNEPIFEGNRPVAIVAGLQANTITEDDIDYEQLEAIEAQFLDSESNLDSKTQVTNTVKNVKTNTVKNVNSLTNNRVNPSNARDATKRPSNTADTKPEKKIKTETAFIDYPDEADLLLDEDEDYLRELEQKLDQSDMNINRYDGPVKISSEPYVFIKQIKDMSEEEKAGRVFKVKAQIMKLLSKLSLGKDGWSLKCTIIDGTGCIDVDFASDVLAKLVGLSSQEMNQMKKQFTTKPELKEKAISALQKAKNTLQVLYCIIELTMLETPTITCLTPFGEGHVDAVKKRLQLSGL